ncbi:MAG: substrate-binding domain-containing protein [Clostridiales Family XIII bacterium]|jgi:simple sugar transport system substrate-binding protein|nr:substrate-binding domain-containing protein [Clostridiales Family XIII bacterium]
MRNYVFITPFVEEEFFLDVRKGIDDAAKMLRVKADFVGDKGCDFDVLNGLLKKSVAEGIDGIALNIIDPYRFNEATEVAMEKGIPIVAFNTDVREGGNMRLSGVAQNFFEAGKSAGMRAARKLPKGAKVLCTLHDSDTYPLEKRLEGIRAGLGAGFTVSVLVTGNTPQLAAESVYDYLKKDGETTGIVGTGQSDTEGSGMAAQRIGRPVYVAGFDTSPRILDMVATGIVDFTIDQQPYLQGFYPLLQLHHWAEYRLAPDNIDVGNAMIDSSNCEEIADARKRLADG